jgi:hypothetical protein
MKIAIKLIEKKNTFRGKMSVKLFFSFENRDSFKITSTFEENCDERKN